MTQHLHDSNLKYKVFVLSSSSYLKSWGSFCLSGSNFRVWHRQSQKSISSQRFADKGPSSQSYGFSSSHVWMWELEHKEGWTLKNRCFQIVVLEKTLESPLDCKEIKPVNLRGNQPWIFIRRTETKAPILWSPNAKSQLIGKDIDAGKDWRRKKKGDLSGIHLSGNEMVS